MMESAARPSAGLGFVWQTCRQAPFKMLGLLLRSLALTLVWQTWGLLLMMACAYLLLSLAPGSLNQPLGPGVRLLMGLSVWLPSLLLLQGTGLYSSVLRQLWQGQSPLRLQPPFWRLGLFAGLASSILTGAFFAGLSAPSSQLAYLLLGSSMALFLIFLPLAVLLAGPGISAWPTELRAFWRRWSRLYLGLIGLTGLGMLSSLSLETAASPLLLLGLGLAIILLKGCLFLLLLAHSLQAPAAETAPAVRQQRYRLLALSTGLLLLLSLIVYQQGQMQAAQADAAARLSQLQPYQRPVLRPPALAGNGAPAYMALLGQNRQQLQPEIAERLDALYEKEAAYYDQQTQRVLPYADPGFEPLIQALQTAADHALIAPASGETLNGISALAIGRLMLAGSLQQCLPPASDCLSGAKRWLDVLRLSQDLQSWRNLYLSTTGQLLAQLAQHSFLPVLKQQPLQAAELQALLQDFEPLLATPVRPLYSLQIETLTLQQDLDALPPERWEALLLNSTLAEGISLSLLRPLLRPLKLDAAKRLAAQFQQQQALAAVPVAKRQAAWQSLQARASQDQQQNLLLEALSPEAAGAFEAELQSLSRLRASYLFVALEAWRVRHGLYPDSLSELVPAVIPALPLDPWSEKAFGYRRQGADYVLYISLDSTGLTLALPCVNGFDPSQKNCPKDPAAPLCFSSRFSPPGGTCQRLVP